MTTRTESIIKVYIDTNVLVNYITGQTTDVASLNYVFKKRRKETLFTSSLALVQTITQLQKGNKNLIRVISELLNKELNKGAYSLLYTLLFRIKSMLQ